MMGLGWLDIIIWYYMVVSYGFRRFNMDNDGMILGYQ